mgnify:CR=1 FL=1
MPRSVSPRRNVDSQLRYRGNTYNQILLPNAGNTQDQNTIIVFPQSQNNMKISRRSITSKTFSDPVSSPPLATNNNNKSIKQARQFSPGKKNTSPIIEDKKCDKQCLKHMTNIKEYLIRQKNKYFPVEKVKCLICLKNIKWNTKDIFICSKEYKYNNSKIMIPCGVKLHKKCVKNSCKVSDIKEKNVRIFKCPICEQKYKCINNFEILLDKKTDV